MSILLKGFLFAILISFAECTSCLNHRLYYPCKCEEGRYRYTEILCDEGPSTDDVGRLFRALNGKVKEPVAFYIAHLESESIGEKIFGDVPVNHAILDLPNLKHFSNSSFIGQEESMEILQFFSSNLDHIPYQGRMKKLRAFEFTNNRAITIIRKSWFSGIQNGNVLLNLIIQKSKIRSVEKYAFSELVALRELDLSENRLSAFDASIISTNLSLLNVNFGKNRFVNLPVDFLERLPSKAELSFLENKIVNVSPEALEVIIEKDFTIDMLKNPLKCECEWLRFANASATNEWKGLFKGKCQGPNTTKMIYIQLFILEDFSDCEKIST